MKELNTRQWRLHDYLINCAKLNDKEFINKKRIVLDLSDYYNPDFEKTDHNNIAYSLLRKDIRKLNMNDVVMHLFVSSKKGYKVANSDEAQEYLNHKMNEALRKLKLFRQMNNKAKLNGQYRLTFTPYEKEIIETFERNNKVEAKVVRKCNICGKEISQGYCINDGLEYYCSDKCLSEKYDEKTYNKMYKNDQAYWTEWEEKENDNK